MKSTIAATLSLIYSAIALPAAEPLRVLPSNWQYQITSLRGPGCPDFGKDPDVGRTTRLTFGQNTMDGSEIYYWFVAYPHLRVDLAENDHVWCETELSYEEFKDVTQTVKSADYRLRLHKNGTRVIATYDLENSVQAMFKFTYEEANKKSITDVITWNGPLASGQYQKEDSSAGRKEEIYKLPKCGAGKIKFRTELSITGKKGLKGFVASEHSKDTAGIEQYYGIQQGFSYDWENCDK
ncbi:hypothetical protein SNOG_13025 [Parastagonospora nodorum SN15]|nr:hypothetical protein SNOG_13025 [Parastagonospora nodorum SN15]EAT79825.1 hypothetical protein SNOG_13025 [Parastagonospora nodorum SN15]